MAGAFVMSGGSAMAATTAQDRAEALEARCRKAMAQISTKPRGWSSQRVRDEELAYIDRLLDEWLALCG